MNLMSFVGKMTDIMWASSARAEHFMKFALKLTADIQSISGERRSKQRPQTVDDKN